MNEPSENFRLEFLDHVAIRVKDLDRSASWYSRVLGLKKVHPPEWGAFPIFMMSGRTGLALFPANSEDPVLDKESRNVKIDHFAFHVTPENFKKALERYKEMGLKFHVQDHHFFHSVYTSDPDGHTVELTTLVTDPARIYKT